MSSGASSSTIAISEIPARGAATSAVGAGGVGGFSVKGNSAAKGGLGPDRPGAVFAADDGRAIKRAVKAPLRNGAEALVEDGLKPGERVVVYPSDALRDGSRITAR